MFAGNNLEFNVNLRVKTGIEPEELHVLFLIMLLLNVHSFPLTGYHKTSENTSHNRRKSVIKFLNVYRIQ